MFDSFNRYLGVAVGECLGYLLTGTWTVLAAIAMLQSSTFEAWLAWPGVAIGVLLVIGSLEFVGASRRRAGSSPGRSCRSPTPSGRCGSSPLESRSSRNALRRKTRPAQTAP